MKSRTTATFRRLYAQLPRAAQTAALKQFHLWRNDPTHPSVQFKPITGYPNAYSARVTRGYRVIGRRYDDTIVWGWIGTHAEYDAMLRHRP